VLCAVIIFKASLELFAPLTQNINSTMNSICFYQSAWTRTAFSNKVTCLHNPFAFVPTERASQHTKWNDVLKHVKVVKVVNLISFNKKGLILKQQPVRDGSDSV